MKIKSIITAALALIMATGCNGQNKNYAETFQETSLQNEQTSNSKKMNKSIVIFFSHAGDNYSVGVIDTGNTKIVADYISEITGADQFEISSWPRKRPPPANCRLTRALLPTSAATTPSSSAVPCGGAPTRK